MKTPLKKEIQQRNDKKIKNKQVSRSHDSRRITQEKQSITQILSQLQSVTKLIESRFKNIISLSPQDPHYGR